MNIDLLKVVGNISYNKISALLPSFLAKLHRNLEVLVVQNYADIADGIRSYLKLNSSIENDLLINQIIGILLIIYLDQSGISKLTLINELDKVEKEAGTEDKQTIQAAKYFIANSYEIVLREDLELISHKAKLILMEKVSKIITDPESRDKAIDLMLLMGN